MRALRFGLQSVGGFGCQHQAWKKAGNSSRIDLRLIESTGLSWRYRNRQNMHQNVRIYRFASSPCAQAEVSHSSDPGSWNKTPVQFGANVVFRKRFDFEPYYEDDNNVESVPDHVYAFGLTTFVRFWYFLRYKSLERSMAAEYIRGMRSSIFGNSETSPQVRRLRELSAADSQKKTL